MIEPLTFSSKAMDHHQGDVAEANEGTVHPLAALRHVNVRGAVEGAPHEAQLLPRVLLLAAVVVHRGHLLNADAGHLHLVVWPVEGVRRRDLAQAGRLVDDTGCDGCSQSDVTFSCSRRGSYLMFAQTVTRMLRWTHFGTFLL